MKHGILHRVGVSVLVLLADTVKCTFYNKSARSIEIARRVLTTSRIPYIFNCLPTLVGVVQFFTGRTFASAAVLLVRFK